MSEILSVTVKDDISMLCEIERIFVSFTLCVCPQIAVRMVTEWSKSK
jgi:hypothetical protein